MIQVRPHSQTIAILPRKPELPGKQAEAAARASRHLTSTSQTGDLPRFGEYARPLLFGRQGAPRFGASVPHAIEINKLDPASPDAYTQKLIDQYPDLAKANEIRKKAVEEARAAGLDPYPVSFFAVSEETMLQLAARGGFLKRYPHWSWGQEYFMNYKALRMLGHMPFLEVVTPGNPVKAYLVDREPKKLSIVQALARSDFFKNNYTFKTLEKVYALSGLETGVARHAQRMETYGQQLAEIVEKRASQVDPADLSEETGIPQEKIEAYLAGEVTAEGVGKETVEGFIDKIHSIRNLIDSSTFNGMQDVSEIGSPTADKPVSDVLGFMLKNAPDLKPWQRDILGMIRSESYILLPQSRTQLMSDGWVCYWNERLNVRNPRMFDMSNLMLEAAWGSKRFRQNPVKINTYQVGYEMYRQIEKELEAKVRLQKEKELRKQFAGEPDQAQKVEAELQALAPEIQAQVDTRLRYIARLKTDESFVREYLRKETVEALLMYNFEPEKKGIEGQEPGTKLVISDDDYEAIKARLIEMFANAGEPMIQIVDDNHRQRGELLLKHVYTYDLKQDYAQKTLLNLAQLWGKPVYLDTYETNEDGKQVPIRLFSDGRQYGKDKNVGDNS